MKRALCIVLLAATGLASALGCAMGPELQAARGGHAGPVPRRRDARCRRLPRGQALVGPLPGREPQGPHRRGPEEQPRRPASPPSAWSSTAPRPASRGRPSSRRSTPPATGPSAARSPPSSIPPATRPTRSSTTAAVHPLVGDRPLGPPAAPERGGTGPVPRQRGGAPRRHALASCPTWPSAYYELCELDRVPRHREEHHAARSRRPTTSSTASSRAAPRAPSRRPAPWATSGTWRPRCPTWRRRSCEKENALCVLIGRPPGPIPRGKLPSTATLPLDVPAGLPSALLERRPDVQEAEEALVAYNANVGAAKASMFPTISLTGLLGGISPEVNQLFGDGKRWSVSAGLFQPLFHGGALWFQYEAAKALYGQSLAQYEQAVNNAFAETSASLVANQKLAESEKHQQALGGCIRGRGPARQRALQLGPLELLRSPAHDGAPLPRGAVPGHLPVPQARRTSSCFTRPSAADGRPRTSSSPPPQTPQAAPGRCPEMSG